MNHYSSRISAKFGRPNVRKCSRYHRCPDKVKLGNYPQRTMYNMCGSGVHTLWIYQYYGLCALGMITSWCGITEALIVVCFHDSTKIVFI